LRAVGRVDHVAAGHDDLRAESRHREYSSFGPPREASQVKFGCSNA
jgi:hypothetical protein